MKIFMYGATILAAISWIPSMFFSEKLLSLFNVRSEIIEAGVMNFKFVLLYFHLVWNYDYDSYIFPIYWRWEKKRA